MAFLGQEVTVSELPTSSFEPIAAGKYTAMITASEFKPTKDGAGRYLQIELDLQSGDAAGRKLYERLNLENKNQQAVEIAWSKLGEIAKSVGVEKLKDSDQLHNKRLLVDVEVEPGKPYTNNEGVLVEGKPQNRIKKYMPYGVQATSNVTGVAVHGAAVVGASGGGAEAQVASGAHPWKRH